jgi:flagellin-like protein
MKLKALLNDDDAVSPVIGVILMVAITVILAAVIASFVLGLGDQNNPAPTASFDFDYDGDGSGSGNLTITHGNGDELSGSNIYVRGSGLAETGQWTSLNGSPPDPIAAGDSYTLQTSGGGGTGSNTNSNYEVSVVWEDPDSDQTSTLDQDEGPDA